MKPLAGRPLPVPLLVTHMTQQLVILALLTTATTYAQAVLPKSSSGNNLTQAQGLQHRNSHDVVTLCQIPIPHDLQDARFTLVYTFETTGSGKLIRVTKVMNDFLPDEPFVSCMSRWRLPSLLGKGVAEFSRTPTEGWTEIHVSGKGFDQSFPYHPPSHK